MADRILMVEDDRRLAATLQQGLQESGFAPAHAPTARRARELLGRETFALAILDLGLPDEDGLQLLAEWRAQAAAMPVIITTARSGLDQRVQGLEGGADDYLVKPYAFAELLARIRVQLRHAHQRAGAVLHAGDLAIDPVARVVARGGRTIELTPREFDLLAHLALAHGQPVAREVLAREVWRVRAWTPAMDNVLDVHISRLRDKIDRDHPVRLLQTIRGVGFALRPPA